uniref:Uncharacterized protein n=1 Tax=Lactuca sativa TaxID=4236 RepID=A0A9R1WRJ2_LACSA|nr:hypothetical protein LSAT_V11C100020050 [Lactuca sativa]
MVKTRVISKNEWKNGVNVDAICSSSVAIFFFQAHRRLLKLPSTRGAVRSDSNTRFDLQMRYELIQSYEFDLIRFLFNWKSQT